MQVALQRLQRSLDALAEVRQRMATSLDDAASPVLVTLASLESLLARRHLADDDDPHSVFAPRGVFDQH